jgi:hypothetical protein
MRAEIWGALRVFVGRMRADDWVDVEWDRNECDGYDSRARRCEEEEERRLELVV